MALEEWEIVILGDPDAGAFGLAMQFVFRSYFEVRCAGYDPTIYDEPLRKRIMVDDRACVVELTHMQGAEQFTSIRDLYIQKGQGFVLAFSVTSRASFEHVKSYHDSVRITKGRDPGPISIVIGNNYHRYHNREVSLDEGRELAHRLGCGYHETSMRHAGSIEDAFSELVRRLLRAGVGKSSPRRKAKRRGRMCLVM
ncbi:small GTPase superfamily [Infundibulicybe gibba]|nr:small GTPase superfamily [Infundibulicybe gibba]